MNFFTSVQIQASFPGGMPAFSKYLYRNLNANVPSENGAPAGKYTVYLLFDVSRHDGALSEIRAENDPGYGMVDEAIRVLKKSPKWTPAENNGRKVNMHYRLPIVFTVETE